MAKFIKGQNGYLIMQDVPSITVLDESIYYASGLAAETTITIPNSGSFSEADASDILIVFDKKVMELTRDFNVLGGGPSYTQIEFVYALPDDAVVNFKQGV